MNGSRQGELVARHYAHGGAVRVVWDNGAIQELAPAADARENVWVAPGLVDLQVNGYAGVDFQQPEVEVADFEHAARTLAGDGCAVFFATLITDAWEALLAKLRSLRRAREQSPLLADTVGGWHIEGPFLSSEPGYHGAHDPGLMCDPTAEHIQALRQAADRDRVLLTLAPERAGSVEAIRFARTYGMTVSLGHTNASSEQLAAAVAAGASGFTHFGNAVPQMLSRYDNILWRALDGLDVTLGLIPDGHHVSPMLMRLVHRLVPSDRIYFTTDAMAAAGAPPGRYPLGRLELEVGADGVVRMPGQTQFAGSGLRPIDGVRRAAAMLGKSWREVWDCFSTVPARFVGVPHGLHPGAPASFCVLECDPADRIENSTTFVRGRPTARSGVSASQQ
jgi:N-acetylglucosamine-6-phosphate deacetylase